MVFDEPHVLFSSYFFISLSYMPCNGFIRQSEANRKDAIKPMINEREAASRTENSVFHIGIIYSQDKLHSSSLKM
jgi:hypothetical protein